ncbi:MAG: hypothetical protein ABJD07_01615 [Gemmatimonadaceae bacterium]
MTRPVTDREVPLGGHTMQPAIHAWLDGDLPESAVRRGDMVRDVEFWQRINKEAEGRRQIRSPMTLADTIMSALPDAAPAMTEPWWKQSVAISPVTALAASAGLVALGMALQSMRTR